MYMQEQDSFTVKQGKEFSRPVESIMRCGDFKSNFARKLSNRYISRSPSSSSKQDSTLTLRPPESNPPDEKISENAAGHTREYGNSAPPQLEMYLLATYAERHLDDIDNVPERIEQSPQLSKQDDKEQTTEASRSPDKPVPASQSAMRHTEVTALHMEVDTLRWQLAQTEANRQMHIALLNQIVTFLNRVKYHIECQKTELSDSNGKLSKERVVPRSFNAADIPRSRSVIHVNKNQEYPLRSAKKLGTRKISKSISNVNGYKDCNSAWNQSKMSLTSETDHSQKITEEISRLITLANTVLSTKLPDLACNDVQSNLHDKISMSGDKQEPKSLNNSNVMNLIEEDVLSNPFGIKSICNRSDQYDDLPSSLVDAVDDDMKEFLTPLSSLVSDMETEFTDLKISKETKSHISEEKSKIRNGKSCLNNKKLDYSHTNSKYIEDESGFSSMSSFQEIGIPIISIIPPSPCKEMAFVDDIPEVIEETGKWKTEIELSKQTVKVFWV